MKFFEDSRWWRDYEGKDEIINKLKNSSLDELVNSDNINAYDKFLLSSLECEKSLAEVRDLFSQIVGTYAEIMAYNYVFDTMPAIKDTIRLLSMFGSKLSCSNMKSYAKRVAKFAKLLKEVGITECDAVKDILPVLKGAIVMQSADDPYSSDIVLSSFIKKHVNEVVSDMSADMESLVKQIKQGYILNEIESELNSLY